MPLTETMDIRPLLLVLGTTITHLGLYHSMPPGHFVVWLLLIANPCSRVCIYARMCSVGVCVSIRDRDRVTETHSSQIQRHRDVSTHVQKCHFWRFATDSLPTPDLGGQRLDVPSNRRYIFFLSLYCLSFSLFLSFFQSFSLSFSISLALSISRVLSESHTHTHTHTHTRIHTPQGPN